MYTVFGTPLARTFRVLWTLEELELPYTLEPHFSHSPPIKAVNPSGKVPILKVGDDFVTDSSAIITYLADKHGKLTAAAGTIERAKQDAVTNLLLDEMDAVLWTAARHTFILPEERRFPEIKDSLRWEFVRNTNRLADRLQGPFLIGEDLSIADIICVHCLNWAVTAKFPVESDKLLEYAENLRSRDAFQKVAALAKRDR